MPSPQLNLPDLIPELSRSIAGDLEWSRHLAGAGGVHLAILVEPFLTYLLSGRKTVESRFGKTKTAPYRQVGTGDVVFLKRTGGPIVGMLRVDRAEFIELNGDQNWQHVRGFADAICADEAFWIDRREKQYATLLHVAGVKEIKPIAVAKKDRRPWVILKGKQGELPGLSL